MRLFAHITTLKPIVSPNNLSFISYCSWCYKCIIENNVMMLVLYCLQASFNKEEYSNIIRSPLYDIYLIFYLNGYTILGQLKGVAHNFLLHRGLWSKLYGTISAPFSLLGEFSIYLHKHWEVIHVCLLCVR